MLAKYTKRVCRAGNKLEVEIQANPNSSNIVPGTAYPSNSRVRVSICGIEDTPHNVRIPAKSVRMTHNPYKGRY